MLVCCCGGPTSAERSPPDCPNDREYGLEEWIVTIPVHVDNMSCCTDVFCFCLWKVSPAGSAVTAVLCLSNGIATTVCG